MVVIRPECLCSSFEKLQVHGHALSFLFDICFKLCDSQLKVASCWIVANTGVCSVTKGHCTLREGGLQTFKLGATPSGSDRVTGFPSRDRGLQIVTPNN